MSDTADFSADVPVDFDVYFDARIQKPDGTPYSTRAKQNFVKRYRPPVIRLGWATLIVPSKGDAHLASLALHRDPEPEQRRGPGRPRKTDSKGTG
jgi:hypothetical protein